MCCHTFYFYTYYKLTPQYIAIIVALNYYQSKANLTPFLWKYTCEVCTKCPLCWEMFLPWLETQEIKHGSRTPGKLGEPSRSICFTPSFQKVDSHLVSCDCVTKWKKRKRCQEGKQGPTDICQSTDALPRTSTQEFH